MSEGAFEFDLFSLETLPPGMADTFDRGCVGNVRLNGIGSKALAGTMRAAKTAVVWNSVLILDSNGETVRYQTEGSMIGRPYLTIVS